MCFKELDDLTTRVGPVCLHIIREIFQVIQGRMVDPGWNMHTPTEAIGRRFHTVMAKSVLLSLPSHTLTLLESLDTLNRD